MSDDLMPFGGATAPAEPNRGAYQAPHRLTQAGQLDRRNEDHHVVVMRQSMREVEQNHMEVAKKLANSLDEMDADDRRLTFAKLNLDRQRRLSQALGGDPELDAKFGMLDDDAFRKTRARLMGGWT